MILSNVLIDLTNVGSGKNQLIGLIFFFFFSFLFFFFRFFFFFLFLFAFFFFRCFSRFFERLGNLAKFGVFWES